MWAHLLRGGADEEPDAMPAEPLKLPSARRRTDRRSVRSSARRWVGFLTAVVTLSGLLVAVFAAPASAATHPTVDGLSTHYGAYWGGMQVTVRGQNLTHVQSVEFGSKYGYGIKQLSATKLTVYVPEHSYDRVHVRVVTSTAGATATSTKTAADLFTFTHATMDSPIYGGLTPRQEQGISAQVRAAHHGVHSAAGAKSWTPALGVTAVKRARSWLGLPYSWAGGNTSGPTTGVCAHNGGDLDCHVVGFDCSGLALYSWAPYETLVHSAATQYSEAGRFHPTIGELVPGDLVFFSGYIADGIGHVAVYEGNGMVIEAAESGTLLRRSPLVDVIAGSGIYRGATRPMSTGRQGATPVVSAVTDQVSANGGDITITGSKLDSTTSVTVAGQTIYSFVRRTSTQLVVKAPAHAAGPVTVGVSNAWGTANSTLTYVGAPVESKLAPSNGPVTGGTTVTITGKNLASVTRVTVGSTSVAFTAVGTKQLTISMPAHAVGSVAVTLYSDFGQSSAKTFTYVAPAPPTPTPTPTVSTSSVSTAPTPPPTPPPTSSTSATSTAKPTPSASKSVSKSASASVAATSTPSASAVAPSAVATPSPSP